MSDRDGVNDLVAIKSKLFAKKKMVAGWVCGFASLVLVGLVWFARESGDYEIVLIALVAWAGAFAFMWLWTKFVQWIFSLSQFFGDGRRMDGIAIAFMSLLMVFGLFGLLKSLWHGPGHSLEGLLVSITGFFAALGILFAMRYSIDA